MVNVKFYNNHTVGRNDYVAPNLMVVVKFNVNYTIERNCYVCPRLGSQVGQRLVKYCQFEVNAFFPVDAPVTTGAAGKYIYIYI